MLNYVGNKLISLEGGKKTKKNKVGSSNTPYTLGGTRQEVKDVYVTEVTPSHGL